MLGAKGGTSAKKKSHAPVSAAALGDAMGMQTDDAAGVNIDRPTATARDAKKSTTSVGRVARAVEADLTQEACVALDALLAEVERGERAETCSLDLCSKVLGMCQRAGKAKPALRLLTRMELCGLPVGPVQLRQVFFACCARGMTHEALALMARRGGSETSARALGKDVLVRGCGMVPGGADARTPWRSWRARCAARSLGTRPGSSRRRRRSGSTRPRSGGRRRARAARRWKAGRRRARCARDARRERPRRPPRRWPRRCHRGGEFLAGERRRRAAPPRGPPRASAVGAVLGTPSSRWNRPGSNRTPTAWTSRVCPARSC